MRKRVPRKNAAGRKRKTPDPEIAEARHEAQEQLQRRDERAAQLKKLRELEAVASLLDDLNHPVWWALAILLLPHVGEREDESFHDAVVRITRDNVDRVREAFQSARAPFILLMIDLLSGKTAAHEKETEDQALRRILLERGASSYAAVRIAGGHDDRISSAGLPQKEVRAARRLAERLRAQAVKKHGELVEVVLPHKAVIVGRPSEQIQDGLLALLDGVVRGQEKQQAEIVRNIDRHRRKKPGRAG